jgi:hypothetical protein
MIVDQKKSIPRLQQTRFGITEAKKAELDALTIKVLDAQYDVDRNQAIVTALTDKLNNFQSFLAIADNKRTQALSNKNLADQLLRSSKDLQDNSQIAFTEMVNADDQTKKLAAQTNNVLAKLIYSAEVINKLINFVIRKKALNPLISDDLIGALTTAGADANKAVALTLVALKSTFAAQASAIESEQAMALEYLQAQSLYATLNFDSKTTPPPTPTSLTSLLYQAYSDAKAHYDSTLKALNITTIQLDHAQNLLNKSQVSLRSLQSGLAAGNAAALAS